MVTEELSYCGTDPGATKFGNFINYYSFHSTEERITNLNPEMFPLRTSTDPIFCLDIGCNTGDLTHEFYYYVSKMYPENDIHILAIDIDPLLIKRAKESNKVANITYLCIDITSATGFNKVNDYLRASKREIFDITFCFSVTMWIHINNGDEGLFYFLKLVMDISQSIIIEPQPWHCYRNAQRRVKKSGGNFPLYEKLKIRSEVDRIIEANIKIGDKFRMVYESEHTKWKRKIQSFHRKHIN